MLEAILVLVLNFGMVFASSIWQRRKRQGRKLMPKSSIIILAIIALVLLSSCAKRNTEYQEEEWLTLRNAIPVVGNPLDIKIDDNYIYVAQDQGGMSRINRNNYQVKWITEFWAADGTEKILGRIKKVAVVPEHNFMFIVDTEATDAIRVIDTTDEDSLVYKLDFIGGTSNIKDLDGFAITPVPFSQGTYKMVCSYCAAGSFKYDYYDGTIFNSNVFTISPGAAAGCKISGNYIYIAAEQLGLYIYDRNDRHPVGNIHLSGEAQKVELSGSIAYVAGRQSGLHIVDVSNPASPVLLSTFDTTGYATALAVSGNKLALSSGSGGIYLFDISNPSKPQLLQHLTSCGYTNTVKFMDDKLVVGARDQGILIYEIK